MTFRSLGALLAFLLMTVAIGSVTAQESQPTPDAPAAQGAQPAQPAAAPPPDTVVAIVNGNKVTRADVIASAQSLPAEYQSKIDAIFPALIDRLVDLTLLAEEGRKRESAGRPRGEGADRAGHRSGDPGGPHSPASQVDDDRGCDQGSLREICLRAAGADRDSRLAHPRRVGGRGQGHHQAARGRRRFRAIAKEKSTDPSAKQNGGDLGYFTAGEMVPEFSQAVFAMEKGESSKAPVKSQFGWHVIKVVDKRPKAPPTPRRDPRSHRGIAVGRIADGLPDVAAHRRHGREVQP